MPYLDDWGSTPTDERKRLQEQCADSACRHMRYLHGDAWETREDGVRKVVHEPGRCSLCRCTVFWVEPPITADEILDLADALGGDAKVVTIADLGVSPIEQEGSDAT